MDRIEELRGRIAAAARSYWETGFSPISDTEYDRLVEELKRLTGEEDVIGAPRVASSGKVEHPVPMLSMNKVYMFGKVAEWVLKYGGESPVIVMPKYDGIALVRYPDGTIATRGDGKTGEDVTDVVAPIMRDVPPGYGECVCPLDEFAVLKAMGYKSPRNAVSGIVGSLDPAIRERVKHLEFVSYRHIVAEVGPEEWCSPETASATFPAVAKYRALTSVLHRAESTVRELARRYPLDGVVFRFADEELFRKLGHTDHHWRGQIALKFANETADSVIRRIDWQEKNGTITPVAQILPVELGGAQISRVTLHNAARVKKRDVRPGDGCRIERAGGVIPKLVLTWHNMLSFESPTRRPEVCPTCGGPLLEAGARLYCPACDKRGAK